MANVPLLNTPKQGLRNVNGDIVVDSGGFTPGNRSSTSGAYLERVGDNKMAPALDYFFAPFNSSRNPGLLSAILVGILVFLGCLFNGWVVIASLSRALASGGDVYVRTFVLALVQAAMFYVCSLWTFETQLPTYILPEISMFMIATGKIGLVTAIGYGVFQFGGFLAAGGILKALGVVTTGTANDLMNIATSSNSYWLYWFGGVVIVFSWMWNSEFRIKDEGRIHAHMRSSAATAIAIFALLVAFGLYGIVSFSSGLYVTGVIITGRNEATFKGDGVYPWAFWVFVALLAVPATVALLYILFVFLASYVVKTAGNKGSFEVQQGSFSQEEKSGYEGATATAESRIPFNVSQRVRNKIDVTY